MKNGLIIEGNDKFWYKNDLLHREDGPAIECANGDKIWYKEDKRHRLDGPAVEFTNGNKLYYKDGKFHREDGPAIELADGNKYWCKEGNLHRLDGPAIECANGNKEYHVSINENISLVYIPNNKAYVSISNENVNFPCSSPEEFFQFVNLNLYKLYLTFL